MERLPLYCQDQRRGEVALALWGPNGARTEIAAQMVKAWLKGEESSG